MTNTTTNEPNYALYLFVIPLLFSFAVFNISNKHSKYEAKVTKTFNMNSEQIKNLIVDAKNDINHLTRFLPEFQTMSQNQLKSVIQSNSDAENGVFTFPWSYYIFGDSQCSVEIAQENMMFITMGKSFNVGYKVKSSAYDALYTWSIKPLVKNSLDEIVLELRAEVQYKNQLVRSIQKMVSGCLFEPVYRRSLDSLVEYLDVRIFEYMTIFDEILGQKR